MSDAPTDWVSGERVFAPPNGTLDPDWLVPAVLDAVPGATADDARAALVAAWGSARAGTELVADSALTAAAAAAVDEAVRTFRV